MERALEKFNNCCNVANVYKNSVNVYLFLKECGFRTAFAALQQCPNATNEKIMIDNLYMSFQMEIAQYNWSIYHMQKEEYQSFLEFFYKNIDYDTADMNLLQVSIDLTENLGQMGTLDDLANKRITYFRNKMAKLVGGSAPQQQQQQQQPQQISHSVQPQQQQQMNVNPYQQQQNMQQPQMPMNKIPQQQQQQNNGNAPSQSHMQQHPQMQMNQQQPQPQHQMQMQQQHHQQQLQMQNGQIIYQTGNPPKQVDRSFKLPMSKKDPRYKELQAKIEMHIEYSNLELDYHKIPFAREHLEAASYYLRNIVD